MSSAQQEKTVPIGTVFFDIHWVGGIGGALKCLDKNAYWLYFIDTLEPMGRECPVVGDA